MSEIPKSEELGYLVGIWYKPGPRGSGGMLQLSKLGDTFMTMLLLRFAAHEQWGYLTHAPMTVKTLDEALKEIRQQTYPDGPPIEILASDYEESSALLAKLESIGITNLRFFTVQ